MTKRGAGMFDPWSELMNVSHRLDNDTLAMLSYSSIRTALPIVYMLVMVISLPGNGLSLILLLFNTKPKTPSIIFMINLTVTDLLLACFLPFQCIYHWNGNNWVFGPRLCNVVTVLFYANMYGSIMTMTCISVERYLGVVHLVRTNTWRKRFALGICLGMWVFILIVFLPLELTDLTYQVHDLNITTCFDILKKDMLPNQAAWASFLFTLFFILFLVPFFITVFCYIRIVLKLVHSSEHFSSEQKRRAIWLALIVLLVFITCFAPNNIILLIHMISRLFFDKGIYAAYKITLTLSCLNSCLDPFIYYLACKEFRKKLRQFLRISISSQTSFTEFRRESFLTHRSRSGHQWDPVEMQSL
uniref:P2Y purinoceptor 8-like n=1 Tax=Callorhinchus milii TaxID=7868 RepID=A0A4W3K486_CALMI|eukprot:gi/632947815/ref/XP_007889253.1/ PREDICTED: P2Y purinoceptor 8-like [Callorhinchus milii]